MGATNPENASGDAELCSSGFLIPVIAQSLPSSCLFVASVKEFSLPDSPQQLFRAGAMCIRAASGFWLHHNSNKTPYMPLASANATYYPTGAVESSFQLDANTTANLQIQPAQPSTQRRSTRRNAGNTVPDAQPTAVPLTGRRRNRQADPTPTSTQNPTTADQSTSNRQAVNLQSIPESESTGLDTRPSTVPFSNEDPFSDAPGPTNDARPQTPMSQMGEEHFSTPSPSSSQLNSPREPSRSQGLPRAGRRRCPRSPAGNRKGNRAKDIWPFYVNSDDGRRCCLFCRQQHAANSRIEETSFSVTTGTSGLRKHLADCHLSAWVNGCDQLDIEITAAAVRSQLNQHRRRQGQLSCTNLNTDSSSLQPQEYSPEAFVDAIMEWIVMDDQSLNVVENPQLRLIFLMLKEDLRDSHIPHRATIRTRITEVLGNHLKSLKTDMAASIGKISFTMDMWSDTNLTPFMAVTAHWIESTIMQTPRGPQFILKLRADLIGFQRVPGRHTGEHLAHAFLFILKRINIRSKIGWVTLDNASNNDTFMVVLALELRRRGILFDSVTRRIRCFPHIVNLACKAVLGAITATSFDGVDRDPIARIRALVCAIRSSSLRRQYLADIVKTTHQRELQLLRDVDTRWSSTLLMIERALELESAITKFLETHEFEELRRFELTDPEWNALELCREILMVPHAFQQRLSAEKTPTLCDAIPSFEAMARKWEEKKEADPDAAPIIQDGLDKLSVYRERADLVPAYVTAMILNPTMKLRYYVQHAPEKVLWAKNLFLRELTPYYQARTQSLSSAPQHAALPTSQNTPARRRRDGARVPFTASADDILGFNQSTHPERTLEQEIEVYLLDTQTGTNCVEFWQENQLHLPTLFLAAVDHLPIQGSAVPCERVFSSAKETMTPRRNRINGDLMEALQMLKYTINRGRGLDFTDGTSKQAELQALELSMHDEVSFPEDVNAFIQALLADVDFQIYLNVAQLKAKALLSDYLKKVEGRLREEEDRVERYLNTQTKKTLISKCEDVLIREHSDKMWGSFHSLLDFDEDEDLQRTCSLLSRIPECLERLCKTFEEDVKKAGLVAVSKLVGESDANVDALDPKEYVDVLLEVHERNSETVSRRFGGEAAFVASLDKACREIVNRNAATGASNFKSPELIAKYADLILRKNNNLAEESELEGALDRVMILFKYIEDKEVFQTLYASKLSKRLVYGVSASDKSEETMISKLEEACGFEYTNKLQRMLTDTSLSKDLTDQFKSWMEQNHDGMDISFTVMVLGTNVWPLHHPPHEFSIPREILRVYDGFQKYYQMQHSGRKLTWLWNYSKNELRTNYLNRQYILKTSTFQMAILLQYNKNDTRSLSELSATTSIPTDYLARVLAILVKAKILVNEETDEYNLNPGFKSKNIRVNLNFPIKSETKTESTEDLKTVDENRKYVIRAAIVRIMKARKTMECQSLIQEVISQLSERFVPKVPDIKKAIDTLLENENIERVNGTRNTFGYMA